MDVLGIGFFGFTINRISIFGGIYLGTYSHFGHSPILGRLRCSFQQKKEQQQHPHPHPQTTTTTATTTTTTMEKYNDTSSSDECKEVDDHNENEVSAYTEKI